MIFKSKKGTVLLLICSVAFLLTTFLLVDYQLKTNYLGQRQTQIIMLAKEAEVAELYLNQMVRVSLAETWGGTSRGVNGYRFSEKCGISEDHFKSCLIDFKNSFEVNFNKNLAVFNELFGQSLKYENFNVNINVKPCRPERLCLEIKGDSNKPIEFKTGGIPVTYHGEGSSYSIKPEFDFPEIGIEELSMLT